MQISSFRQRLRALGANPQHEQRVLRDWLLGRGHEAGRRKLEDFLPLRLREALPALGLGTAMRLAPWPSAPARAPPQGV